MSDIALRVEGLGKRYRIGLREQKCTTLRDSITAFAKNTVRRFHVSRDSDEASIIWALKDLTFTLKQGQSVGLIGHNGAGKSTLLKILSRITSPTEGYVQVHGRVGSLLEVGTGFHPELSGRDNVYLNGAILGMKRAEIKSQFDEIVAFSEVDKFIDTPVKHYSSGMYLRLAFAVAAHLQPDILLVDEVLSVGDAVFRERCLGKMKDVASSGRTVIIVSHDLATIRQLSDVVYMLKRGQIDKFGPPAEVISHYLLPFRGQDGFQPILNVNGMLDLLDVSIRQEGNPVDAGALCDRPLDIAITYRARKTIPRLLLGFDIKDERGSQVFRTYDTAKLKAQDREPGVYKSVYTLPASALREGRYFVEVIAGVHRSGWLIRDRVSIPLSLEGLRQTDIDFPGAISDPGEWVVRNGASDRMSNESQDDLVHSEKGL